MLDVTIISSVVLAITAAFILSGKFDSKLAVADCIDAFKISEYIDESLFVYDDVTRLSAMLELSERGLYIRSSE